MKIACFSLWNNSWKIYWTKFLKSRGHQVSWLMDPTCNIQKAKPYTDWCDVILCHWAIGWTNILTKVDIDKPIFVIHRSFETFDDTTVTLRVDKVRWDRVTRLFMLNEAHFPLFNSRVKNVQPIFIKNGIDIDFWKQNDYSSKKDHLLAWIANLNFKKGEQLAFHALRSLQKTDSLVQMEHLGNIDSVRVSAYLNNITPYFNTTFFTKGIVKQHDFVRSFLLDKRYIFNSSLAEGHPMNIIEAMAMGCQPLLHRYPGVEHQFPEKWIWSDFDDLKRIYQDEYKPEEYRQYIIDHYDYRKCYLPVAEAMESV